MSRNADKTLNVQETSDLVPMETGKGSYAFINPRRSKKQAAVIVDTPLDLEFQDDVPTVDIRPNAPYATERLTLEEAVIAILAEGSGPMTLMAEPEVETRRTHRYKPAELARIVAATPPDPVAAREEVSMPPAYHDPNLCSCEKMNAALAAKVVMVVVAGPVTLAPAFLREDALLKGSFSIDSIDSAYDGKQWAFRHCPFNGCLIDEQVEVLPQVEKMTCCGKMLAAVEHGRVELPEPDRPDRSTARFTDYGRPAVFFSYCPWCATDMTDLAIARYKRCLGL